MSPAVLPPYTPSQEAPAHQVQPVGMESHNLVPTTPRPSQLYPSLSVLPVPLGSTRPSQFYPSLSALPVPLSSTRPSQFYPSLSVLPVPLSSTRPSQLSPSLSALPIPLSSPRPSQFSPSLSALSVPLSSPYPAALPGGRVPYSGKFSLVQILWECVQTLQKKFSQLLFLRIECMMF